MATQKQRDEKRRAARLRTNAKHRRNSEVDPIEDEVELLELSNDEEEEPVEELVEKSYDEPMGVMVNGPTSWEEHEAMKMAREKAEQVRHVTWTTQDLVSNILYASMTPEEKSNAIKAVGDGMGKKLKEMEKEEKMEKELNFDLLELQALIAKDARHMSVLEKADFWLSKFKPVDVTAVFKDKTEVRQALTQSVEMIEKDQEVPFERLMNSAKEFGIGTMEKSHSAIVIQKDKTGNYRAVMWPSNNFIDWDGDIISEVAHKEYVEWVNKNMEYAPLFMTWHKPGTMRKNRVDFVGYENGFLLMSAPLELKEAAALLKAQTLTDIGMSHGTLALERDSKDPRVVTKYRMVEVSDLPLKNAANPFTDFETLLKEADMSKDLDTKAYLATILGSEEEADKFIAKAGIKQKALQDAGVESKEKQETPDVTEPVKATVDVEAITAQVFERISKELDVEGLNSYLSDLQESAAKVPVLESLVKELAKDQSEKVAEMIEPPAAKTLVWQKARASQNKENVLDETDENDKVLKKAKPELGWLSEATGTQPIQ